MKVTIYIKDINCLLARAELVRLEKDAKSKRAVMVAAKKAIDATTYIGCQFSDSLKKVYNKLNYKENE